MIIGISGKAGSGKDTVADYLVQSYGFTKVSFASTLKNMLSAAGFPEPSNRDDKEKLIDGFDFSWRHAAQTLGTEWGRVCLDDDIWVKLTMRNLEPHRNYVFSDVRFPNEADAIRNIGHIIHLSGRMVDLGNASQHTSEVPLEVKAEDAVIENIYDKAHLFSRIDVILNQRYGTK